MLKPSDLFDLSQTEHAALFEDCEHAWDPLKRLRAFFQRLATADQHRREAGRVFIGENVWIGEGTVIEDGAMIKGPALIGTNCQIRHNAYLREHVIAGDDCVLGNACEFKSAILFNGCQVPHFSYVGDSILGHKAHLGAGVKISNVKLVPGNVCVEIDGRLIDTGLRKFGAVVGDRTDVGCNSVLNPGSVIGRGSIIYPNTCWRGVLPEGSIAKNKAPVHVVARRQ